MAVRTLPITACAIALVLGIAIGCQREHDEAPAAVAERARTPDPAPSITPVVPCSLLTLAEVARVLPDAEPGRTERGDEPYGIHTCIWSTPKGQLNLQVYNAGQGSVDSEIRGLSFGLIDIRSPNATTAVRLETVAGVGDQSMALVEREDPERGIRKGNALIVTQSGARVLVLRAPELASRDRKQALGELERLAKAATSRL